MDAIICPKKLQRSGVVLTPVVGTTDVEIHSIYWNRYKAIGTSDQNAFERYLRVIQEPNAWRSVADEVFAAYESYQTLEEFEHEPIVLPMAFWNALVQYLFRSLPDL